MDNVNADIISLPLGFIDEISRADDIEAVMRTGTKWLGVLVPSDRNSIAIMDGQRLVASSMRFDGGLNETFDIADLVPGTPRAQVIETGEPLTLNAADLRTTISAPLARLYRSGIRSVLITPLTWAGDTVGTISVASAQEDTFDERDRIHLKAIGNFIAVQAALMQQVRATARLAGTDNLTGLANRHALMHRLNDDGALHTPANSSRALGLLHIDLDHFKEVNDTLGHSAGDTILVAAANTMRATAGLGDMVARIGGDEFIFVTHTDRDGQRLKHLAEILIRQIRRPISIDGIVTRVGASIGTAIADADTKDAEQLIENADLALYEVKRNGRNMVEAYRPDMRRAHEAGQKLLMDLQDAVANRSFVPYFQPQISLSTGQLSGFEMLARWPHPTRGLLGPTDFMDLAVESRLLDKIDGIVRDKGLTCLRQLRDLGWDAPKMSFNASARTLVSPDLANALTEEVTSHGLTPEDLVLEIREAHISQADGGNLQENITQLAKAGFAIELDDFGTGFSCMSNLSTNGITGIKIDKSLIASLPEKKCTSILRAILTLAHELGLNTGAAGVETTAQFATLKHLGCDYSQGHGVSEALPLHALIGFMENYGRAPLSVVS